MKAVLAVFLLLSFLSMMAFADSRVPDWVKSNAGWWADGEITDTDFISGIQYLISNEIISIPDKQSRQSTGEGIPGWIKNNAKWWAEGKIAESDFLNGIQYLITNGVIQISVDDSVKKSKLIDIDPESLISKQTKYKDWKSEISVEESLRFHNLDFRIDDVKIGLNIARFVDYNPISDTVLSEKELTAKLYDITDIAPNCYIFELAMFANQFGIRCLASDTQVIAIHATSSNSDISTLRQIVSKLWSEITLNLEKKYTIKLPAIQQQSTTAPEGFSGITCKQDEYGFVKIQGKFTNGETPYNKIFLKMAVIGFNGEVLATGMGMISNVGAYQTKIFDATAEYDGPFKSCEIEIDTAYK